MKKRILMPVEVFQKSAYWLNSPPILKGALITVLLDWLLAERPEIQLEGNISRLLGIDYRTYLKHETTLKQALNQIMGMINDVFSKTDRPISDKERKRRELLRKRHKEHVQGMRAYFKARALESVGPSSGEIVPVQNFLPTLLAKEHHQKPKTPPKPAVKAVLRDK